MREKTDPKVKTEHFENQDEVVELSLSTPPTRLETQDPDVKTDLIEHGGAIRSDMQCRASRLVGKARRCSRLVGRARR